MKLKHVGYLIFHPKSRMIQKGYEYQGAPLTESDRKYGFKQRKAYIDEDEEDA